MCASESEKIEDRGSAIEWRVGNRLQPYPGAVVAMEARVAAIRAGTAPEMVWLVEHPPLYTAGTSAKTDDLLMPDRFPVFRTGRGANTPITDRANGSPM